MNWNKEAILEVLDHCAEAFTFPALDNGYVYLAATRMSVYRSGNDWAIVIEVFGFSPRSGDPDTQIYTFSSQLANRNSASDYVSEEAYQNYLRNNPYNESSFVFPIEDGGWKSDDDCEFTSPGTRCVLRGEPVALPEASEYQKYGISLEGDVPLTFEFCRYLAGRYRDKVLCTEAERRINVAPDMELFLVMDEWSHPDVTGEELPSQSETFVQVAEAIVSGNKEAYRPSPQPNTHWIHWPEGGTL